MVRGHLGTLEPVLGFICFRASTPLPSLKTWSDPSHPGINEALESLGFLDDLYLFLGGKLEKVGAFPGGEGLKSLPEREGLKEKAVPAR